MRAHIGAQKFVARFVAQHADHGVIHVEELPFRRGEKQSFLNIVEQLAVAPFGFAAVA